MGFAMGAQSSTGLAPPPRRRYPRGVNPRPLLLLLAVTASTPALAAETPPAGGVSDLLGPRTLALGGGVGLASGNEGLFVNPGATAARRRYGAGTLFAIDRRGGTTEGKWLGASVVDAAATGGAASFAYLQSLGGPQSGDVIYLGFAGAIAEHCYLGVQGRYFQLGGTFPPGASGKVNAVSADAGLFWEVTDGLTLGAAGYNLVPTGHTESTPRGAGAGVGVGSDTGVKVVADWRGDFDRGHKSTNRYSLALEALLGATAPVRVGWQRDETLKTSWWMAGIGLVTQSGVSLDVGYRQSVSSPDARTIEVALTIYPEVASP
jgi:hypothetical protein